MNTARRYIKAIAAIGGGIAAGTTVVTVADAMAVLPPETPWWGKLIAVVALGVGPGIVTAVSPRNAG